MNYTRKIKLETSLDDDCYNFEPQVLKIGQHLKINASDLRFENMTREDLKTAGEMFLFMKVCPSKTLKPWMVFYKDLFETQPLDQILLTLNRMTKGVKTSQNEYFLILAQKLLRKTMSLFDTKSPVRDFDITNHPVHIMKDNKVFPSAFIPFCDFGGNMSAMGMKIDQFSVKICSSFEPKIMNDQLCYSIDLDKFSRKYKLGREIESGFAFFIDYNEDRQVTYNKDYNNSEDDSLVNMIVKSDENMNSVIHIDTIGEF